MTTLNHAQDSPVSAMNSASYVAGKAVALACGRTRGSANTDWMDHARHRSEHSAGRLCGAALSTGAVLLTAVIARLMWRITHPVAAAPSLTPWEHRLASTVHGLIYVLLVIIPVLGWAAAGYYGYTVRLFGLLKLPGLADGTMEWAHTASDIHAVLVNVLLAAIGLHVAAAFYHHFVRRDRVLQRMLPWA